MTHTKYNGVRYDIADFQIDSTWQEIEKDSDGNITAPQGLVEQLTNEALEQEARDAKSKKFEDIEMISTTVNSVEYDGHTRARADLTGVTALANFEFIKALVASNPEFQPVYDAIYKQTKEWLGKDNKPHNVQIESVAEAGIKAYETYAKVIGVK